MKIILYGVNWGSYGCQDDKTAVASFDTYEQLIEFVQSCKKKSTSISKCKFYKKSLLGGYDGWEDSESHEVIENPPLFKRGVKNEKNHESINTNH